jgi:hypothetical protein
MIKREAIIQSYIDGYNQFDIEKMVMDFDEATVFKNISNGVTNMTLTGLAAFKEQAEQAKTYFTARTQSITRYHHQNDETEIEVDYYAILALDFPNGLKKGDELRLKGRSIFKFRSDKIIQLTDIT